MTAPSDVGIWNRALQLLGAERVQSTSDTSRNAVACQVCYEPVRDRLLEQHVWRFAIKQASLPADATAPSWGRARAFTVPSDFIMLAPDFPEDNSLAREYEVQNGKIYTDYDDPLYIRYVAKITNPAEMTPTFRELLAHEMAMAMCEEITQSNTKKSFLQGEVKRAWEAARRANGRLMVAQEPPEDPFISVRV